MDKKNILRKIKELFNKEVETEMANVMRIDGVAIYYEGTELVEGETKLFLDEEMTKPAPDGEHELEGGLIVNLKDGILLSVKEKMEEKEDEDDDQGGEEDMGYGYGDKDKDKDMMEDLDTELMDGTKVRVSGGVLSVGKMVLVEKDGEYVKAPEGQHNLKDGRVIYVDEDGLINEIETSDTKKEEEDMSELFNSISKLVDEVKSMKGNLSITNKLLDKMKKENYELKEKFSKFSKEPSTQPTKHEVKFSKMDKDTKLKFFANQK